MNVLSQPVGGVKLDLPAAAAQPALAFGRAPGRAQQQCHGQVGGGLGQDAGRVAHRDAASRRLGYVNIVQAHRKLADRPQARRGVQQVGIHAVHDGGEDAVGVSGLPAQFLHGRRRFLRPHGHVGNLADDVQCLGKQRAGNECARGRHGNSPSNVIATPAWDAVFSIVVSPGARCQCCARSFWPDVRQTKKSRRIAATALSTVGRRREERATRWSVVAD